MERMAEVVPDSDDQTLQLFITPFSWDEGAVINQIKLIMTQINLSTASQIVVF